MHRHWCHAPLRLSRPHPAGWNSEQPPENRSNLFQTFHPTVHHARRHRVEQ